MTASLQQATPRSRGALSTALIAFVSIFGGLLWIGRGRLALLALLLPIPLVALALAFLLLHGWTPAFAAYAGPDELLWGLWLAVALLSVAIALSLRRASRPRHWYSHGLAVLLLSVLVGWGANPVLALAVRTLLYQPFSVPAESMLPGLRIGDTLFASKFAYGWGGGSLPFAGAAMPARGDVVVFRTGDPEVVYVKRVLGLPGDRIQVSEGIVRLNGRELPQVEAGSDGDGRLLRETLPEGRTYLVLDAGHSIGDDTQEWTVPENNLFMLGDNRDNSNDSRFDLGMVPIEALVGRGEAIFWNAEGDDFTPRRDLRASR